MSSAAWTADCQVCQVQGRRWGEGVGLGGCPGPRGSFSEISTFCSAPGLGVLEPHKAPAACRGDSGQGLKLRTKGPRRSPWQPPPCLPPGSGSLASP